MSIEIVEPVEFIVEKSHYLIDGKKYWRATRVKGVIYNPELIGWMLSIGKKKANEIRDTRAAFGTKNHQLFKLILEKKPIKMNYDEPETNTNLSLFSDFILKYNIQPELLEQHLWSEKYGYAGTADFIGYVDNKLMILDWKTSKAIYPDMWLQLAAYAHAFKELTGKAINSAGILQLRDNKTKFEVKKLNEIMKDFDVFKACLKIFKWQKGDK